MLKSSKFEDKENVDPGTGLPISRRRWLTETTENVVNKKRAPFSDITPVSRELSFGVGVDELDSEDGGAGGNAVRTAGFEVHTGKVAEELGAERETAGTNLRIATTTTMTKKKKVAKKKRKGLTLRMNTNVMQKEQKQKHGGRRVSGKKKGSSFLESLRLNVNAVLDKENNARDVIKGGAQRRERGALTAMPETTRQVVAFMR